MEVAQNTLKTTEQKHFCKLWEKLDFETRTDAQIYSTVYLQIYYLLFVLLEKTFKKGIKQHIEKDHINHL